MLEGKVTIITGASSGIGQAVSYQAAKRGAKLVLVARRQSKLDDLAAHLRQLHGCDVVVVAVDLTELTASDKVIQTSLNHFGTIDALINVSGMGEFQAGTDTSDKVMESTFAINTFAMMRLSRDLAIFFIDQSKPGQLIFIGSVAGKIATANSAVYAASKHAIIGYANSLRLELRAHNIKVSTVNTGPVRTAFFSHSTAAQAYYKRVKHFALDPDKVASRIIRLLEPGGYRRELTLPSWFNAVDILYRIFPRLGDYLASTLFNLKEDK